MGRFTGLGDAYAPVQGEWADEPLAFVKKYRRLKKAGEEERDQRVAATDWQPPVNSAVQPNPHEPAGAQQGVVQAAQERLAPARKPGRPRTRADKASWVAANPEKAMLLASQLKDPKRRQATMSALEFAASQSMRAKQEGRLAEEAAGTKEERQARIEQTRLSNKLAAAQGQREAEREPMAREEMKLRAEREKVQIAAAQGQIKEHEAATKEHGINSRIAEWRWGRAKTQADREDVVNGLAESTGKTLGALVNAVNLDPTMDYETFHSNVQKTTATTAAKFLSFGETEKAQGVIAAGELVKGQARKAGLAKTMQDFQYALPRIAQGDKAMAQHARSLLQTGDPVLQPLLTDAAYSAVVGFAGGTMEAQPILNALGFSQEKQDQMANNYWDARMKVAKAQKEEREAETAKWEAAMAKQTALGETAGAKGSASMEVAARKEFVQGLPPRPAEVPLDKGVQAVNTGRRLAEKNAQTVKRDPWKKRTLGEAVFGGD